MPMKTTLNGFSPSRLSWETSATWPTTPKSSDGPSGKSLIYDANWQSMKLRPMNWGVRRTEL